MANKVYPKFRAAAMRGGANVNLVTSPVKMLLVDTGAYTYADAHEFVSDIPGGAIISRSAELTGRAVTDLAAFITGNGRFESVTGVSVEAIGLYVDTGSDATSRLIFYQDTGLTGLPVTPAGASYNVVVDPAGWFVF